MTDLRDRLETFRKEGAEKFVALSAAGNAVRNFADAKRENSADDYDLDRITTVVVSTLETSVKQSSEVYKMFARGQKE